MSYTEGYHAIFDIYDKLNADVDYEAWADFVEASFDRYLSERPELVLDLACGTGSMTLAGAVCARLRHDRRGRKRGNARRRI